MPHANILETILADPEDLSIYTEWLPGGALLRIWRGSKLVSAHGIRSERTAVPTGGLIFEVSYPSPIYGPVPVYTSRLRPDRHWTNDDARARYAHVKEVAAEELRLIARREHVHTLIVANTHRMHDLVNLGFEHGVHLDVYRMDDATLDTWERLLSPSNSALLGA